MKLLIISNYIGATKILFLTVVFLIVIGLKSFALQLLGSKAAPVWAKFFSQIFGNSYIFLSVYSINKTKQKKNY